MLYINTTQSWPKCIYLRADLVVFLKHSKARKNQYKIGDLVTISQNRVFVNGKLIIFSKSLNQDLADRKMMQILQTQLLNAWQIA